MGNSPSDSLVTSTASSINQEIPWSKQFTMLDKQPLNNTYILHHIPTNNSYKLKHMTLNKTQHQQIFRQIDMKKNTPSPFVTKLQKTQQYTVKGYCSEHQQVFLMYKYIETNLKQEILNRRFRQEKFLEQEIKVIMQAGVKGISYLHQIGCTPKGLNTSEVLLTQQRAVLINDPWLSVGSPLAHTGQMMGTSNRQYNNEEQNGSKIFSIPIQDYPSPQKILYMNQLIEQYNQWLSELFTFGMIVLETIFMTSLNEQLYEKSQKKIYYHRVKEKVQEIIEGEQMEKSSGRQSFLNEIKQDLRRLLSHQPKIRQSVYLKYKKNHTSYLFLKKPKDQFKLNSLQNNNINQLTNIESLQHKQPLNNNNIYESIDKKLNSQQDDNYIKSRMNFRQAEKNRVKKQNWVLNSINQQHNLNLGKEKQQNRFRVVSSGLPQTNKISTNTFQLSKPNYLESINNNMGYRQLGGISSNRHQQPQNKFSYTFNKQLNTTNNQQFRPNSFLQKININSNSNIPLNFTNPIKYTNFQNNNNQPYQLPSQSNSSFVSKIYQDTKLRTGQLSPKKQTLVEKQTQTLKYNSKGQTVSTIPSSPYLSTISTNAYQSQINPLFGQDYNKSQYDNFSQLKLINHDNTVNLYHNNIISLPSHMVTRSSSSYVIQNGKTYDQKNTFTYKQPQKTVNNNWTYESMVSNKNGLDNPYDLNEINRSNNFINNFQRNESKEKVTQFKTPIQQKNGYSAKISLSQSYLNKYNPNYQNDFNKNKDPQDYTTKRSQYQTNTSQNSYVPSSYQTFKQNFPHNTSLTLNLPGDTKSYNNFSSIYQQKQSQKQSNPLTQDNQSIPKIPSYKELNNFNFRQVGSLYYEDSHFLNDKESIVIQSYSGGMNKYQPINRVQIPINTIGNPNIPTISPKNSFQINHSMINNTRNEGKSFSSMDEDVKQLRKFGQQPKQLLQKKPNSSYSSSQKVSLIDKIYDPQVMGSFDRRSFQNKQDYFGTYNNHQEQEMINNRSSQNISNRKSIDKPPHSRNNSSQNYLQTPQRYPNKYKLNSTIRQASCEDSGVNQSHNNSNGDSYQNQKVYPNTQISKYQIINQERRYSERKVDDDPEDIIQKGIKTDRACKKQKQTHSNHMNSQNPPTFKNIQKSQENNQQNNQSQQRVTLYADGSRFIGPTDQRGQSHGYGVLYYPDGHAAYQGQWEHGDFNGKGKLYNPYQLKMEKSFDYRDLTKMDQYIKQFEGNFNHDVKQGKGKLKMHNNQVYEGEFSNDLPNGRGKFYCSDGNIVQGIWERGYLQQTF